MKLNELISVNKIVLALIARHIKFLLFLVISFNVFGQQYNFINYSIEDGLIQSQVRSICQDKGGYIWLGTHGGISRFDGISFENFSSSDGLLNDEVYAIASNNQGDVFIGSKGGINIYTKGKFVSYEFRPDLKEYYVLSIVEDKENNIWLGLEKDWLVKFKDGEYTYFNTKRGRIHHLFCDENNGIWVSSRKGIAVVDQAFNIKDSINDVNVSQVLIVNDTMWYSTYGNNGVYFVHGEERSHITTQEGLIRNNVRGFIRSKTNDLWFYTKKGLTRYRNGEMESFTTLEGLQSDNIRCLMEDREGNLFMGTDGTGFMKFSGDQFVSYTVKDGLENDVILSITEDNDNNIWLSTNGGGVSYYDGKQIVNYNISDGIINNTVWSSLKDNDGNLLFGTSSGISLYDGRKFTDMYYKHHNTVWSMYQDHHSNIWAGTIEGLLYFDRLKDTIVNYSMIENINKNVKSILSLNDQSLWFCSDNGIHEYSYSEKKFSWFSMKDGLPDNFIMSAVKDKNEVIWVGTSKGLAYFKDNRFVTVNFSDISGANFITFLKVDDDNNLWIGSNRGLFKLAIVDYDFQQSDFIYYSNLDGLVGLECNQNSVFIDSKKSLWFGTSNGLMKFNLNKQEKGKYLPTVHLKGVRLFFEDINWSDYSNSSINQGVFPNLTFKHNQDHLTFDYIAISHSKSSEVRYQFKLEGNDDKWSPMTSSTYVTYSNLTFGNYSFFVKASIDNKNWTEPVRFDFTITPPFYFTSWFFLLSLLFIISSTWLIISRRRRLLERKKATQLIIDKAKILELEHQALNASMNRHFIFNALNSIQYYINRQDKLAANKYLSSFAKLIRKNLDSSLVNEVVLEEEITRIELYLKLEQMRFQDKFTYAIQVDKKIEQQLIKIPPMLLQPFIENSIIHGILPMDRKGHIAIKVQLQDRKLIIDINDNGIGIDNSLKIKQEKSQYNGKQKHVSKGMKLIKGRIDLVSKLSNKQCLIDGPKQIYDKDNNVSGTTVSIIINF